MKALILSGMFLLSLMTVSAQKLVAYPAPEGAELNSDFTVQVRQAGQEWKQLPSYLVHVAAARESARQVEDASMSYFDFEGEVEVSVTSNKGTIRTARVRPLSYGTVPQINGNTLTFKLNRPRNLSVEVNDDIFHNLHLFANPVDEYVPNPKDKNLIYFGPGIHTVKGGRLRVESGKTVYLSGGAILKGQILVDNVRNVKVLGRGMVDKAVKEGIRIANSQNILVEGIIATQCPTGGSDNVTVRNVKSISYYQWGDGMNVFASNNVLFDGVFCRNSDDCTTVYATRKGFNGGCKNITMQNSTLWADVAHPVFIGLHGNENNSEILEDLNYINIDILDHKEKQIDYQGCLAINAGDNNLVRNVRFENIRIEDFREGQLVNLRIFFNKKYCKAPGKGIEDVLFKDISYTGSKAEISIIAGYNEERKVKNIRFENLRINGQVISDNMPGKPGWYKTTDMSRFFVGEHVEDIEFVQVHAQFTHPGILHSREDLHRMKEKIFRQEEPWKSGYGLFLQDSRASYSYKMQGPFAIIGRGVHPAALPKKEVDDDCMAAYYNALQWIITGNRLHADKAIEILNGYAYACKEVTGRDKQLMGLNGFIFANAAEIMAHTKAGWNESDILQCKTWFREVLYPAFKDFATFANGNWDIACTKAIIAAGVFLDDREMYNRAVDYYLHGEGNGRLTHYIINEDGQCQESGRDQAHTQLGIGCLAEVCEVAYNQGSDLYAADNYRLLKGYEYTAKYNLGNDVPFQEYTDRTGKYHHQTPADRDRGKLRGVYEIAYNHYVVRKKMEMPYTEQAVKKVRPEGIPWTADHPGYGTLLFSRSSD